MSDVNTETPQDNPEDQLPRPVLPTETTTLPPPEEISPPPAEVELTPDPPRKRGRPKKVDEAKPRTMSEAESDKFDFDSWIGSFPWDQPGMSCKVERISPEMVGPTQTSGVCGQVDNMGMTSEQIRQQFGGGRYHISVIGPRYSEKTKSTRIMRLSHKPLKIPGDPNMENLGRMGQPTAASVAQQRVPQSGGPSDPNMVRLVDRMIEPLQRRVDTAGQQSMANSQIVGQQLENAAQMKIAAADQMLREKDALVAQQVQSAETRVQEARREAKQAQLEKEKAMEEVRAAQQRIYDERRTMEETFTNKLSSVHSDGNSLIATLLPQAQQQAQAQINTMMTMFETRISSQEASYTNRLEGLEQSYRQRMAAQADFFKSQAETSAMLFQGQIQQLQQQLVMVQGEKTLVMTQLEDTRNRMMEEISKVNKARDPEEQLVKLGGLLETVKGITGLGGGDEAAAAGSGNPFFDGVMANIGKVAEVVPHITGAIAAKAQAEVAQSQAQQPQMMMQPQQMLPPAQQHQIPQEMMMQPIVEAPPPQAAPRKRRRRAAPPAEAAAAPPAEEPTSKGGKIPREELDKAVIYINSALESNPGIQPEDFSQLAISSVDNGMLRQLSRQKAELVVGELEKMGVLHGQVSTEQGQAWLCKLLDVLRAKL